MTTDRQVRKLRELLADGMPLYRAALWTGMTEKTARRYRATDQLPGQSRRPQDWRTHEDPFEDAGPRFQEQVDRTSAVHSVNLPGGGTNWRKDDRDPHRLTVKTTPAAIEMRRFRRE